VSGLNQDLDRALRALPVSEAPVERARRAGRLLRTRRRLGAAAGALAVIAVAAVVPVLVKSPAPVPLAASQVVTAGSPAGATQAPSGLASQNGEIAVGTAGAATWQVTLSKPLSTGDVAQYCYRISAAAAGVPPAQCSNLLKVSFGKLSDDNPVSLIGFGASGLGGVIGLAAPDVTYVIVTLTDGQHLKLIPVSYGGRRYVAWIAPAPATIASVAAHLGGPYSDSGQFAGTIPFSHAGLPPFFGRWQRNGYPAGTVGTAVIGHGTSGGHAWSVTDYAGPWGNCFELAGTGQDCAADRFTGISFSVGGMSSGVPGAPDVLFGSATPDIVTVRLTLSNGQAADVHPATVGGQHLYAYWGGPEVTITGFTNYDAAGHDMGGAGPTVPPGP
jgi:hypothetical protein